MKEVTVFALFAIMWTHSLMAWAQHGVAPQWGPDIELPAPPLSASARGFLYSNMGVFSSGKRVVFLHKEDAPTAVFYTYSYDGVNWSTPQLFAPASLVIGLNSPVVIADHQDTLHVIWASQLPKALYYTKMDSALNVVLDSVRIADNPQNNAFHDMYLTHDLQGRIHAMWNEGDAKVDTAESFYSRSLDGGRTWESKVMLTVDDDTSSVFPRGQFNAYGGDTLAIAWRNKISDNNWDIQMTISTDGGASWGAPFTVNPSANDQGDPDVVIDPYGRIHLFYHEAPVGNLYNGIRIVYGYSDDLGATWHPSSVFYNNVISRNEKSRLVEGSRYDAVNDVLWTFWKEEDLPGHQGGDMLAAYSLDRGMSWSVPEYVTDRHDTSIGYKAVALLPNGNVGINYELPNYPDSGKFRVFYKERARVVTAVKPSALAQQVRVYPDPTTDAIRLDIGPEHVKRLEIFTAAGRRIGRYQDVKTIDVSHLTQGLYFIRVYTADRFLTGRFIKK